MKIVLDSRTHLPIRNIGQGELLGPKWFDLDWQRDSLWVQRQVQRTGGQGMVLMSTKTRSGGCSIQLSEEMLDQKRRHFDRQQVQKTLAGRQWVELDLIFPSGIGTPQCPSYLF